MFELHGGTVTYAGELVHGKTSLVTHDGKGIYDGIPNQIQCTRYHSLAGLLHTLPSCLQVTSTTPTLNSSNNLIDNNINNCLIMGVRHKTFVMEGVQYHPESIASEHGRRIFANFLSWEGGSWDTLKIVKENVRWDRINLSSSSSPSPSSSSSRLGGVSLANASRITAVGSGGGNSPSTTTTTTTTTITAPLSILEKIHAQRLIDIKEQQAIPGKLAINTQSISYISYDFSYSGNSYAHLARSLALGLAPPQIDFRARLLQDTHTTSAANGSSTKGVAVLAEIKRASPSKGDIDVFAHAPSQGNMTKFQTPFRNFSFYF